MIKLPWLVAFLALGLGVSLGAQAQNDTVRVFYMGNSFLYCTQTPDRPEVPEKLAALAAANGHTILWDAQISGSKHVAWHWQNGGPERMREHPYQAVILQDQSLGTIATPHAFLDYVERFGALAAERQQRLLLFMTMGYYGRLQMIDTIAAMYNRAGRLAPAEVVPCGLAWKIAYERYPELRLHHADRQHPLVSGVYLNVYMFYRALFGEKPTERVKFDLGGLGDEWYERLEACADEAMQAPQTKQ